MTSQSDDDSDVDVCSLDDDTLRNLHTGLTVVAAETYVQTEKLADVKEEVITLTDADLLKNKCPIKKLSITAKSEKSSINSPEIASKDNNLKKLPKLKIKRSCTEQGSENELLNTGVDNKLHRFSFESDHLAIKNNADYQALLKSLAVLEAQRSQAIKDLELLNQYKQKALEDPLKFVKCLQNKNNPSFPRRQIVASLPEVNWVHYMASYAGDLCVPQIATRNIIKNNLNAVDNIADNIDEPSSDEKSCNESSEKIIKNENKPITFNKKWTAEEQEKLEKLLVLYPPEEVEQRRYEKIAKALGNRTRQQVTSRIQKYFLKLAKAKLPIPGRPPSTVLLNQSRKAKVNPISYKNSSFFPSWQPKIKMEEGDNGLDVPFTNSDHTGPLNDINVSDDEDIHESLRDSFEYSELMDLKKIKKLQAQAKCNNNNQNVTVHRGFMCDGCGMDPIAGVRWHCKHCPTEHSVDFCNNCSTQPVYTALHTKNHELTPVNDSVDNHINDGSYRTFKQINNYKYNYLDPNFVPSS